MYVCNGFWVWKLVSYILLIFLNKYIKLQGVSKANPGLDVGWANWGRTCSDSVSSPGLCSISLRSTQLVSSDMDYSIKYQLKGNLYS